MRDLGQSSAVRVIVEAHFDPGRAIPCPFPAGILAGWIPVVWRRNHPKTQRGWDFYPAKFRWEQGWEELQAKDSGRVFLGKCELFPLGNEACFPQKRKIIFLGGKKILFFL